IDDQSQLPDLAWFARRSQDARYRTAVAGAGRRVSVIDQASGHDVCRRYDHIRVCREHLCCPSLVTGRIMELKSQEQLKRDVAQAAVAYIRPLFGADAVIGVGTGSTADLFIDELAKYKHEFAGAVASSERSAARLREHGVRVLDLAETAKPLPVYVDGADEINPLLQMVKGGGGAHTREKIVAAASERFVCIVDETKCVDLLGAFAIPLEVIPMAVP